MRRTLFFVLLLVTSWVSAASVMKVRGVGHGDYHFGYISASAGYSSISQSVPDVTTTGDWAALLGAGYEFRMMNAWVSVGVQFLQEKSTTVPNEYIYNTPYGGLDNQKPPQIVDYYRYTIRQKDQQLFRTVDIPLMAGYYNSGFYVGAGVKVGFSAGSSITTGGDFDLGAKYQNAIGIIESNPDFTHPIYHTYTAPEQKYNCTLRTQFSLLGEIGYDLLSSMTTNSTICHMLKIGVYAEYGLRSIHPDDSLSPIQVQGMNMTEASMANADVTQAHMTPYYLSTQTAGRYIVPFYVGVKLTYLIGGSWSTTRTWHKGCQCYE